MSKYAYEIGESLLLLPLHKNFDAKTKNHPRLLYTDLPRSKNGFAPKTMSTQNGYFTRSQLRRFPPDYFTQAAHDPHLVHNVFFIWFAVPHLLGDRPLLKSAKHHRILKVRPKYDRCGGFLEQ